MEPKKVKQLKVNKLNYFFVAMKLIFLNCDQTYSHFYAWIVAQKQKAMPLLNVSMGLAFPYPIASLVFTELSSQRRQFLVTACLEFIDLFPLKNLIDQVSETQNI